MGMQTKKGQSTESKLTRLALVLPLAVSLLTSSAHAEHVRYLVKLRAGSSVDARARRLVRSSNTLALFSELSANEAIAHVRPYTHLGLVVVDGDSVDLKAALTGHPLVEYFEPERKWKVSDDSSPAQSLSSSQIDAPWMNDLLGLDNSSPDPTIVPSGNLTTVAVLDTGATVSHPFLNPGLAVNQGEVNGTPGVDNDGNGYVYDVYGGNVLTRDGNLTEDGTDHGSHVSGLVKAVRDQAIPQFPEAKGVQIMPIRFIGSDGTGSTSAAIDGINYALMRGAKVLNASWGASGNDAFSHALYDAMVELYNNDVFISVAAGNAATNGAPNNNDVNPYFPANYVIPSLMSVASVTPVYGAGTVLQDYYLSEFSNYGQNTVDVAAPGDYVDPQGGYGLWSANAHYTSSSDEFIRMRGTSMATPIVAGIAAVVRAINPKLTAYEVKQLILTHATKTTQLSQIRTASMVQAASTFSAARSVVSTGARPPVPALSAAYAALANSQDNSSQGGGMCGTVRGTENEGPMGGNSLVVFVAAYVLSVLAKRSRILKSARRAISTLGA